MRHWVDITKTITCQGTKGDGSQQLPREHGLHMDTNNQQHVTDAAAHDLGL